MLRTRQRLGKYVIERRLGEGGFAVVYAARDTLEGTKVALKIPYPHLMRPETLSEFRREVRLAARLEHPHVLPLKNAEYIDGQLVIASALGECTLEERLQKRLSTKTALEYARQMFSAVSYAHQMKIIHCDLKPDNFLIFKDNQIRLTDFGIARVAQRTIKGSGTGTVGYIAPEQALGKPSFRSDVFSLGLILYRMFARHLPEWPYEWPPANFASLNKRLRPDMVQLIRKSIEVDARRRFRDATQMEAAFLRIRQPAKMNPTATRPTRRRTTGGRDWQSVRRREFVKNYGQQLQTNLSCPSCNGPVSEPMQCCPWCGKQRKQLREETSFPAYCPRCRRGMKLDWCACPWCHGDAFEPLSTRVYSDQRYSGRCSNCAM